MLLGIVASVLGLIALPIGTVGLVFLVFMPYALESCEDDIDTTPAHLGVSSDPTGVITARVPPCHSGVAAALQLLAPDDAVLWRAEAEEQQELSVFTIGLAPEGFTDVVPLAAPLDPAVDYEVQLLFFSRVSSTGGVSPGAVAADDDLQLFGGARTTFRPDTLQTDTVFFDAHSVAPDDFDTAACADEADAG